MFVLLWILFVLTTPQTHNYDALVLVDSCKNPDLHSYSLAAEQPYIGHRASEVILTDMGKGGRSQTLINHIQARNLHSLIPDIRMSNQAIESFSEFNLLWHKYKSGNLPHYIKHICSQRQLTHATLILDQTKFTTPHLFSSRSSAWYHFTHVIEQTIRIFSKKANMHYHAGLCYSFGRFVCKVIIAKLLLK